jgi:prepilin-type N-terminal cleavage/methylation domain-containing protein
MTALRARSGSRSASNIQHPASSIQNRGLTLVELLVVIIILTTVVAAAIPVLTPSNEDRRLREAARTLNTFITAAQSRAVANGRPYGIALKRLSADTGRPEDNGVCLEVFYVEQAPPYTGFDRSAKACVANIYQLGLVLVSFVKDQPGTRSPQLPVGIAPDLFPTGMIRPGDVIEIAGTRFELLFNDSNQFATVELDNNGFFKAPNTGALTTILAQPLNDSGQQIKPRYDGRGFPLGADRPAGAPKAELPYWTAAAPYRVLRQASLASDEPYQLPEGTAIDLRASGVGSDVIAPGRYFYVPNGTDNATNVFILFAPEGRVSRVSFSQLPPNSSDEPEYFDQPVNDNVLLLVGRRENVPVVSVDDDRTLATPGALTDEQRAEIRDQVNWLNGLSRWIVIGSQSGRIVTVENSQVDPSVVFTLAEDVGIAPSSEQLRNHQIRAAREFTREMSQLGGR